MQQRCCITYTRTLAYLLIDNDIRISHVSGKDLVGDAVMTGAEPHSAGFRSEKESGQWNYQCIVAFQ